MKAGLYKGLNFYKLLCYSLVRSFLSMFSSIYLIIMDLHVSDCLRFLVLKIDEPLRFFIHAFILTGSEWCCFMVI